MIEGAVRAARAYAERLMPDAALIERWSDGEFDPEDPGGAAGSWVEVESTKGRREAVGDSAADRDIASQHDLAHPKVAILPVGTDVEPGDRVTVGGSTLIARTVRGSTYQAAVRVVGDSEADT